MTQTWEDTIQLISCNLLAVAALLLGSSMPLFGQQPGTSPGSAVETVPNAIHVLGLENVKRGAKGRIVILGNNLRFYAGAATEDISIPSVQDVFTDQDSKQVVRGKMGMLARMAMPYESGRVLSLLTDKIDVLTLEYRDSSGGLHGVIFSFPKGQAAALKRLLEKTGAHVSVSPEALAKP